MKPKRFLSLFLIYTVVIGIAAWAIEISSERDLLVPKFWVLFGFLAVLTGSAYMFSWIGLQRNGKESVMLLMASIIVKFLMAALFVLFYIKKIQVDKVTFVTEFVLLYLLFSIFEIWALLINLRHPNKSK